MQNEKHEAQEPYTWEDFFRAMMQEWANEDKKEDAAKQATPPEKEETSKEIPNEFLSTIKTDDLLSNDIDHHVDNINGVDIFDIYPVINDVVLNNWAVSFPFMSNNMDTNRVEVGITESQLVRVLMERAKLNPTLYNKLAEILKMYNE